MSLNFPRHGRPQVPADLSDHAYLGYTLAGRSDVLFIENGISVGVPVRSRINASNGDVLVEAAVRGMGITCHPDFIVDDYLADGRLVQILENHAMPVLGIYAVLPSNRQVPHRVRVLMDFLAEALSKGEEGAPATVRLLKS